jgi:hypothetical protein
MRDRKMYELIVVAAWRPVGVGRRCEQEEEKRMSRVSEDDHI